MEVEESLNIISNNSDHITISEKKSTDSEDDTGVSFTRIRTKLKQFTETDSETEKEDNYSKCMSTQISSSDENTNTKILTYKKKSRIKSIGSDSESPVEDEDRVPLSTSNNYDLTRTKIKNKKLQDKFKKLKNPTKSTLKENIAGTQSESDADKPDGDSDSSNAEISCLNIKQKFTKKSSPNLSSICDPDTSDEESDIHYKSKQPKSKPRTTKPTSPKAVRMSAKQAMENMHKIKSESNRMLREREVSLPYHRPKALSLKDIMSRRRPALTSDGKSLPIKMNSEQLQQYALSLEQRQKEMMELCKSDTEEEEEPCPDENSTNDLQKIEISAETNGKETDGEMNSNKEDSNSPLNISDKLYDDLNTELNMDKNKPHNIDEEVIVESTIVNESKDEYCPRSSKEPGNDEIMTEKEETKENDNVALEETSPIVNINTKEDSKVVILHYDTERTEDLDSQDKKQEDVVDKVHKNIVSEEKKDDSADEFSDNDFAMDELDKIIENAEVMNDKSSKPLSNLEATLTIKPKLTGAPGTFIDLDDGDDCSNTQKKLTGVELLKERFTYFAKLQSVEDMEKDREKKFKPGTQHLKLKQALEEQIAEQRSLEWEKRLEVENQLKAETNTEEGEEFDGEDIEKIEAKLEEDDNVDEEESSSEEELEEDDCDLKDKPRKRNPMVDDEAEVSDDDPNTEEVACNEGDKDDECEDDEAENDDSDDEDSSDSDEDEKEVKSKKGRILKAFEDSDDEDTKTDPKAQMDSQDIRESQDDEIQLGQLQKSYSEDLFSSQAFSEKSTTAEKPKDADTSLENDLGCQTFSILKPGADSIDFEKDSMEKLDVICETQPCSGDNFDAIAGMCTGAFLENLVPPQESSTQLSQSQEIGDDVAALCTGKFYDNPFISQTEVEGADGNNTENDIADESIAMSPEEHADDNNITEVPKDSTNSIKCNEGENKLLKSILDELGDPEFDSPKPNKYFFSDNKKEDSDTKQNIENTQLKKKFVIESDDETNDCVEVATKKKKRKKRKLEDRALQISDDEEEYSEQEEGVYESDIEEEDNERLVEYDSEENEVEVQTKVPKKKRIGKDFFEQEAELTSEDEWMGSGDEDEAGLDRMEREAGDDDTFHQGKLQRELGEIHMREVLDQDKREVRLLQELLFEDGDLGDGHRQRKFRWKNADGEEELGTNADEYADTQEDEFESEEQWRKQRHEREMFLRKMQDKGEEDANVSINRSAIIKANLSSKTSNVPEKASILTENPKPIETEKKTYNDIPSPKKPFTIFQSNYHNSLLTRGRGALARLAALATPLAGDGEDGPKVNASSNRGNFVFATLTPDEREPKVTKRKAEANPDTPRLLKKMKKQEINTFSKSILDHL